MSVYVFNLLVGYLPNGVDNAQAKRYEYLKDLGVPVKYVFTDMPWNRYIKRYNVPGIEIKDMMCAHLSFTDHKEMTGIADVYQKRDALVQSLGANKVMNDETMITLYRNNRRICTIEVNKDWNYFTEIKYYNNEKLIHAEVYCGELLYTDDFITASNNGSMYAKRIRRSFKNRDGSLAYTILYQDDKELYMFPNGKTMNKSEFLIEFIKNLHLSKEDVIILDRCSELDFVQPLFENKGEAKIVSFLHSGHYFKPGEDNSSVFLNREYYYLFKYSKYIHTFLVSTNSQKEELIVCLKQYNCFVPNVKAIVAGGIDTLLYEDRPRKPYTLLSVSRIHVRKRIHWIMKAVAKAHAIRPEIEMDVYGRGDNIYEQQLLDLEKELNTKDYIHFKGQQNVRHVYKQYRVFITSSLWETLGLSVMEAIASGDAMIGLDARYGNREFIKNHVNGILVDFDDEQLSNDAYEDIIVERLKNAILEIFENDEMLEMYKKNSYAIASDYLDEKIKNEWIQFIQMVMEE